MRVCCCRLTSMGLVFGVLGLSQNHVRCRRTKGMGCKTCPHVLRSSELSIYVGYCMSASGLKFDIRNTIGRKHQQLTMEKPKKICQSGSIYNQ